MLSVLYASLFRNYCAELLAKKVDLLEHFLCKSCVVGFLLTLWVVSLALELVVEVYCLVNYLRNLVSVLVWVKRYEKCAIVNELSNEELDVFLENSKIHNKYVLIGFVITKAKVVKIMTKFALYG